MGLFNKLGRRVEEFRQNAKQAADENLDYGCRACGERFAVEHNHCPECGAEDVVRVTEEESATNE